MNDKHEDAAARALDALQPDEAAAFDAAADRQTREAVDAFRETAAELAPPSVAPPASLKHSVLAAIAATPQEGGLHVGESADEPLLDRDAEPGKPDWPGEPQQLREIGPAERRAQQRWFRRPVTLIASIAAAAVIGIGGFALGASLGQSSGLTTIVEASDVRSGTAELADGGSATILWSEDRSGAALVFDGLGTLGADETYEAWFIRDGQAVAAGIFDVGTDGSAVHVLDGKLQAGDVIGVTVEPAGGSDAPTSEPIVALETS